MDCSEPEWPETLGVEMGEWNKKRTGNQEWAGEPNRTQRPWICVGRKGKVWKDLVVSKYLSCNHWFKLCLVYVALHPLK